MEQKPPLLIDFMLRHAWHRVSRMYNNTASTEGMTMSVGFILMIVEKDGTPSTQLGPKMGMEPTSLSRTLNNMETNELIERREFAGDKRKVNIFLTARGVEKRKQSLDSNLGIVEEVLYIALAREFLVCLGVVA